jgi:DHA1 family tetracycline resistance protein-like MFS transporter
MKPNAAGEPGPGAHQRQPSLGAVFLTVFLDLLGFGLVLPFLAEEARTTFHTTELVGTLLGSMFSLMQFAFVPIWGRLSDRVGRRPVLIWSVWMTGVSTLGLGIALAYGHSIAWLFVARLVGGVATANIGTASAYVADITKPEDRARGMGLIGVASGLGFILGPAIGGVLAATPVNGRNGPIACYVAAGLSLVNLGWVIFGLVESLPKASRNTLEKRSLSPLDIAGMRATFSDRGIALAVLVNFLVLTAFANLDQTFRFATKDLFAMTATQTGLSLGLIAIIVAVVQVALLRPLAKRFGEPPLVRSGTAFQCLSFVLFALAGSLGIVGFLFAGAVFALGNGLSQPSLVAYISKRASASAQGGTLGAAQAAGSLARVFGPALGGLFYGFGPAMPYVMAAVLTGAGVVVALKLKDDALQNTAQPVSTSRST